MSKGSTGFLESSVKDNNQFSSSTEAIEETRNRVRFLVKFVKSNPKLYVTKESRDVIWKIAKSWVDWRQWRDEVASTLSEEGYPEISVAFMRNTLNKASPAKDDACYKLARNLMASTSNFSEYKDFRMLLGKSGAIDVTMAYFIQEISKSKTPPGKVKTEEASDFFLLRSSLNMMLNIMKSTAFNNEFMKVGAINTFASLADHSDEEVKAMAVICFLKLLSSKSPATFKFLDDKNFNLVLIKSLKNELSKQFENSRREFRLPIDAIVDALIFIGQNDINMKKLLQNGITSCICDLVQHSNNNIQLRGVELFLALFADRQKLSLSAISSKEFSILHQKMNSMNSSSVETMPVLKAKKILNSMKLLRNDSEINEASLIVTEREKSGEKTNGREMGNSESSETLLQDEEQPAGQESASNFKDNDAVADLDEALNETRLRINFLAKLQELSPLSLVNNESSRAVLLLNDSFSAWEPSWRPKIIQVLIEEKYPLVLHSYATFLLNQQLDTDLAAFQMLLNFYLHANNIIDASSDCRLVFIKAGFIGFLLNYLGKINPTTSGKSMSANASEIVQKSLLMLYNISRSPADARSEFHRHDAVKHLVKHLQSSNVVLLASLTLANVLDDSMEAARLADEKGVVKTIMDFAISATGSNRKAHLPGMGLFPLEEFLTSLSLLAVNDSNKHLIMENKGVELFHALLVSNKTEEQLVGIELLWSLAFEPVCRAKIRAQKEQLGNPLRALANSPNKSDVQRLSKRALSFIEKWDKILNDRTQLHSSNKDFVYISCPPVHQELGGKIMNSMTAKNLKVSITSDPAEWLESLVSTMQQASVVVACISCHYKTCNVCRAELQLAYAQGKAVIPVAMEYLYTPDGWLGIALKDRKSIDMSLQRRSFVESFDQLMSQINSLVATKEIIVKDNLATEQKLREKSTVRIVTPPPNSPPKDSPHTEKWASIPVSKWTKSEIRKWLQSEKLQKFSPKMEEFDGEKLAMLLKLEKSAPEYYFSSLSKHFNESLPNMLQLFAALSRLAQSSLDLQ